MLDIRIKCAEIVQTMLEDKIFFSELRKYIPENDLPFANMLILTSLRHWQAMDHVLKIFVNKKIPHKHRLAEFLLKTAITEILFMDTAPYAIINQTVQNIKHVSDKFLAGMANAVLRKVQNQKQQILQQIKNISLIPDSFLPLLAGYSSEVVNQVSESIKQEAPLDITVKENQQEWKQKLEAEILPNGTLRLQNYSKVPALSGYDSGKWWVQDVSASLPVTVIGDIKGKKVIDLCAAPGGKTAQLAAGGAMVTALDISEARLQILKQNMQRLGFENIKIMAVDALEYMQKSTEIYEAVLLDAPCSASGTFRRHPEILHIKNINDVKEQVNIQRQMLNHCSKILKKGGVLVYSVCSICKAEGEDQIAAFLAEHKEFKRVKINKDDISLFGQWNDNLINEKGEIRTMPYYLKSQNGMDSFFICKMQRII